MQYTHPDPLRLERGGVVGVQQLEANYVQYNRQYTLSPHPEQLRLKRGGVVGVQHLVAKHMQHTSAVHLP